jgi:hypothetical protein
MFFSPDVSRRPVTWHRQHGVIGPERGSSLPAPDEKSGSGVAPAFGRGGAGVSEERWFMVDLEADCPPLDDPLVELLIDALDASDTLRSSAIAAGGVRGVEITTSVRALDVGKACGRAHRAFEAILTALNDEYEITRVGAQTEAAADAELNAEPEQYAGVSEVAALLGVSRQRVAELRRREGFPAPVAHLAAGPIWRVAMLQRFLGEWARKPGRPPRAATG